ncbi:hypothetical protein EVAR_4077_1 [Eumeta japonica]|uniref:Uncharacterized protein n=1 Tax=Eumeta variegata TaxID=151549 RepID=A0A4C1T3Y4_EUMVA|nr:hypothetical protein EVAR_4077_1 [Eumeta japonica]
MVLSRSSFSEFDDPGECYRLDSANKENVRIERHDEGVTPELARQQKIFPLSLTCDEPSTWIRTPVTAPCYTAAAVRSVCARGRRAIIMRKSDVNLAPDGQRGRARSISPRGRPEGLVDCPHLLY